MDGWTDGRDKNLLLNLVKDKLYIKSPPLCDNITIVIWFLWYEFKVIYLIKKYSKYFKNNLKC